MLDKPHGFTPKGKGLTEQNKSRPLYGRRLKGRNVLRTTFYGKCHVKSCMPCTGKTRKRQLKRTVDC